MNKNIKNLSIITLVLSIVSFVWIIYDFYEISFHLPSVLDVSKSGYLVGIGYLIIIAFNITAIIFILVIINVLKELSVLKTTGFVFGVISLLAIGAEKVMWDEIGKEYGVLGAHMGEVMILYFLLIINASFCIFMFYLTIKVLAVSEVQSMNIGGKDEKIFSLAQYVGIVSGGLGILLTFDLINKQILDYRFWIYFPFYILFLFPYILVVLYWLSIKMKERIVDWYDEKQLRDILKSSLTTLILSIPGLAILLVIQKPISFYWFIYYLFLELLIFSTCTLYFFRAR
ncbi:hypothetical protein ACFLS9_01050 [Bacteroidota bacterium]